jgi:hypothetical protein
MTLVQRRALCVRARAWATLACSRNGLLLLLLLLVCAVHVLPPESTVRPLTRYVSGGAVDDAVGALSFPQAQLSAARRARAVCVLAIFKSEALNLREWVSHYRWQGVDAMLLLDNGSEDAWRAELVGFEDFVTVLDAPRRHAQVDSYNELGRPWLAARGCAVVGVLDLDEFAFADAPGATLAGAVADAFAAAPRLAQVSCKWAMFGSSGLEKHPAGHVRESFTWRAREPHVLTKSFVRLSALRRLGVHAHETAWGGLGECPTGVRLNHYAIQSAEYFSRVKLLRGDVAAPALDAVRDNAYFRSYDFREVEDFTLRDLVEAGDLQQRTLAAQLAQS